MIDWFFFGVLGLTALLGAVQVVRSNDLVHVVLWLALALVSTAGLYVLLDAGFLAAIQILLYTGGVITLMLFAVMLARREGGVVAAGGHAGNLRAGLAVLGFGALVGAAIFGGGALRGEGVVTTEALGAAVVSGMTLPFEALSALLTAAMVGAIVLARRKDA